MRTDNNVRDLPTSSTYDDFITNDNKSKNDTEYYISYNTTEGNLLRQKRNNFKTKIRIFRY